jgi:hypothetical protein
MQEMLGYTSSQRLDGTGWDDHFAMGIAFAIATLVTLIVVNHLIS